MLRYIVQRLFFMIVTMLLVSVIIFIIIELPPGDYADRYAYSKLATAGQSVTESDMIAECRKHRSQLHQNQGQSVYERGLHNQCHLLR